MINNLHFKGIGFLLLSSIFLCFNLISPPKDLFVHGSSFEPLIGAINRAQQGYYREKGHFEYFDIEKGLEIPLPSPWQFLFDRDYQVSLLSPINNDPIIQPLDSHQPRVVIALVVPSKRLKEEGQRTYIGLTLYDPKTQTFNTQVCRSSSPNFDVNSIEMLPLNANIFPYQSGVKSANQTISTNSIHEILSCPSGFVSSYR